MLQQVDTLKAMLGRSVIPLVAVLSLGLAPAQALATPQDVASTHSYIVANSMLARETEARVGIAQANLVVLNRKLGRECGNAGAGSPENEESQKISYEAAGALWSVTYGADARPIGTFVRAIRALRWSNPRLTHLAQGYARSLHELAALPLPNLCADVRAWRASGFRTIPASTASFDEHVESIEGHTIPGRLLAPYERPGDKTLLASVMRLETKLEHTETVAGYDDWESLLETLGLNL